MLKGFLGGAGAVPPLANVGIGVTIPIRAQQKWPGSGPLDWLQHQSYRVIYTCLSRRSETERNEIDSTLPNEREIFVPFG
uniref:Uncharacterized protein n=1 Tax=Romanomermis culicivorax TaxID=13658 RepID=A0A915HNB3_ROMCU